MKTNIDSIVRKGLWLLVLVCFTVGCDRTAVQPPGGSNTTTASQPSGQIASGNGQIAEDTSPTDNPVSGKSVLPAQGNQANEGGSQQPNETPQDVPGRKVVDQTDVLNSTFMAIKPPNGDRPADMIAFLTKADEAIRDLIVAGSNKIIDNDTFTNAGMRLGRLKLEAGEKLAANQDATDTERKMGTIAQLVALSHLSGLKDVESAKKLEKLATSLKQSSDKDLQHQGRVVMLGFRLQDLQNGQVTDTSVLIDELNELFQRPEDAGFTEMMVLQQAGQVLTNMGQTEAVAKVEQLIISKYMDTNDVQLSMGAWSLAASKSRAFENYNAALQEIYTDKSSDPQTLIGAVRGLFMELPYATTLLQLANTSTDIEYRGKVNFAFELHEFVKQQVSKLPAGFYRDGIQTALDNQQRRLGVREQAIDLSDLVGIDGSAFDWNQYRGKVVLIDFWATWCVPCLQEMPNIRQCHDQFADKGFEVVSINMDSDLTPVRQYVSKNVQPWRVLHSSNPEALGFKSKVAERLGITAIPFILLVDRNGKVAAIHVRGEKLAPAIQSLLGN